jgi:hypothetical protein
MDPQQLQLLLKEIQTYIDDFKKELAGSENYYQGALELTTDNELKSVLMEQHVIYTEQQRTALDKMEALYDEVQKSISRIK